MTLTQPPEGTRLVLMSEEMALELGASRVEWGEPDEHGWYTPTLYATPVADTAGIDAARLAVALRDWEKHRHPLPSPDADTGPHSWDAWIAEAHKLLAAALRTPKPEGEPE